jgi:hypothetical protein
VFVNNGDGSYNSGAYSLAEFSATTGLSVDVVFRTPIHRGAWQTLRVGLDAELDAGVLAGWDHRVASPPRLGLKERPRNACEVGVPGGESMPALRRLGMSSGIRNAWRPAPPLVTTGRPYTLRIQIFPDGRCGFALNGEPLAVLGPPLSFARRFRVRLEGNSYETQMAAGPVEIWQGVRDDIDWAAFEARQRRSGETPAAQPGRR